MDKEHKIFLIGCFITVSVIAYLLNWNFDSMADTATTLVSIAVGVYIAAASALLGSPYAKELKQTTDKKRTSNTRSESTGIPYLNPNDKIVINRFL